MLLLNVEDGINVNEVKEVAVSEIVETDLRLFAVIVVSTLSNIESKIVKENVVGSGVGCTNIGLSVSMGTVVFPPVDSDGFPVSSLLT